MIKITQFIEINPAEIKFTFIRSPGPGGQNVNKTATAVLLRFNVLHSSSLPEAVRERLILLADNKITRQGDLLIKAHRFRTQELNKQDAIKRLQILIKRATVAPKKRKKTKPTFTSIQRRLTNKKLHAKKKASRQYKSNERDQV